MRSRLVLSIALAIHGLPAGARADECERIAVWRDGQRDGAVCREDVAARGLTVVDLGDDWAPPVLASGDDGGPAYRSTYAALAREDFAAAGHDGELARGDRYLELYGIEPSLGVVRRRLADDARHRCHDAIDDAPLAKAPARIAEQAHADASARIAAARALRVELEHDRARKHVADLDALAASDGYYRRAVDRLAMLDGYLAAVRTAQAHLACDGLFVDPPIAGAYTWQTSNAVEVFQRGAMILPTGLLDDPTRAALALGSRERDFRTALRVLRGRVVAATGLVEDGTASGGMGTVLGRTLEPDATWRARGATAMDGGAPDLISPATEAAARALGWRDPAATAAFLDAFAAADPPAHLVAIALPPVPAYHAAAMDLSAEIDRGDVDRASWYDAPHRPSLILYATDAGRRIPLVRWPTTIGGWQNQRIDGDIEKRWKESPVGPRIWRDLFVGPRWLPPLTTPDRELVRPVDDRYVLATEELGPSYRAAFGMVAFVHLVAEPGAKPADYWDQGIRTHATGNLVSLANGASHGCHRLLGLHAIWLADFVLAHHAYVRHGDEPTWYRRVVRYGGKFPIAIDSLGYRIELVPPIAVDVLPGEVHR